MIVTLPRATHPRQVALAIGVSLLLAMAIGSALMLLAGNGC